MYGRLLSVIAISLALSSFGQGNSENSNSFITNETAFDSIVKSTPTTLNSISSKPTKKQIRKVKKNKSKGSSLITYLEVKHTDSLSQIQDRDNYTLNSYEHESPIRPAFRPVSAKQLDQLKTEQRQIISTQPNRRIVSMLNYKANSVDSSTKRFFWVVKEIRNGNSSHKSMKLVNFITAKKLISRNKIETKTKLGKHNVLTVWEVYDKDYFMQKQAEDPDYFYSDESELFNVKPYFKTAENLIALN